MDFLETTTEEKSSMELWVDRYRPVKLEDYIGEQSVKDALKGFIDNKNIGHLLFFGSQPGTGKTTAAKMLVKNIPCDYLYLNSSDENGIETIRTKIKGFASTVGFNPIKIIILDEADFLTAEAQGALRNVIETFSATTRFILTCNYVEKIISPIRSRCQEFEVIPPSKKEIAVKLKKILDTESIKHTMEDLGYIVNTYYPDMRKILNFSQQYSTDGTIHIPKQGVVENDTKDKIITLLKTPAKSTTFNEIRQLVADADVKHFDSFYKTLFDKISEYSNGKEILVTLTIAEYVYQSALVVDKEISFMACIARLLKELR